MVNPVILSSFLISSHISRIFNDHDQLMVPRLIRANRTELVIRKRKAFLTIFYIISCFNNRTGELLNILDRHIDNMKGKPLSRFIPDSRKHGKLCDQAVDIAAVKIHF